MLKDEAFLSDSTLKRLVDHEVIQTYSDQLGTEHGSPRQNK